MKSRWPQQGFFQDGCLSYCRESETQCNAEAKPANCLLKAFLPKTNYLILRVKGHGPWSKRLHEARVVGNSE